MNDKVILGPNGHLAIALPLYRSMELEAIEAFKDYHISLHPNKPIGYLLDIGFSSLQFIEAEALEKSVEFLGDL